MKQGLAQGHTVSAFVRSSSKFHETNDHLKVLQGDVMARDSLNRALEDEEAVISALGSRSVRRDPAIVTGIHNVMTVVETAGVARFIYLSADIVRAARQDYNPVRRALVAVALHNPTADHEFDESMIQQSRLDWTIVRLPTLTKRDRTGRCRSGEHLDHSRCDSPHLARLLSQFLLKQLTNAAFVHKAVTEMYQNHSSPDSPHVRLVDRLIDKLGLEALKASLCRQIF